MSYEPTERDLKIVGIIGNAIAIVWLVFITLVWLFGFILTVFGHTFTGVTLFLGGGALIFWTHWVCKPTGREPDA